MKGLLIKIGYSSAVLGLPEGLADTTVIRLLGTKFYEVDNNDDFIPIKEKAAIALVEFSLKEEPSKEEVAMEDILAENNRLTRELEQANAKLHGIQAREMMELAS